MGSGKCPGCGGIVVALLGESVKCRGCGKHPMEYWKTKGKVELRDQFAMAALTGFQADHKNVLALAMSAKKAGREPEDQLARVVYRLADAMMKERDK